MMFRTIFVLFPFYGYKSELLAHAPLQFSMLHVIIACTKNLNKRKYC